MEVCPRSFKASRNILSDLFSGVADPLSFGDAAGAFKDLQVDFKFSDCIWGGGGGVSSKEREKSSAVKLRENCSRNKSKET